MSKTSVMTEKPKWKKPLRNVRLPSLNKVKWLKQSVGELNLMTDMLKLPTLDNYL